MKKPSKKKRKRGTRKKTNSESQPKVISPVKKGETEVKREPQNKVYQPFQKKEPEKKEDEKGGALKYVNIAGQFLRESRSELRKVKWPTRKELLASTAMVLLLVLVISFFLGVIDFGLIKIIKHIVG